MDTAPIDIIIVAAGSGLRFGAPLPKQFCMLGNRPLIMHTIDAMRHHMPDATILLVVSEDMQDFWKLLCSTYDFMSPRVVNGGKTRWHSISNALDCLYPTPIDDTNRIVMVHDGVRPLIDKATIDRLITAIVSDSDVQGAIPAVKVTDSIRTVNPDGSSQAIDRETLRAIQTPQTFRAELLRQAYKRPYKDTFTDDASVMEDAGYTKLIITEGSTCNIKITNPGDIDIALTLLDMAK